MGSCEREREVAVTAVREAAFVCRSVQTEIATGVLEKTDRSPVTVADFASQALVCRALMEAFPNDAVIGEEDSASLRRPENEVILRRVAEHVRNRCADATPDETCSWIDRGNTEEYRPRFWTLDPIDGTKGFLRQDQYAIALALIVEGQMEVGVMGCPNLPHPTTSSRGTLFVAVRGHGTVAIALDDPRAEAIPLSVSANGDMTQARFCESFESAHSSHSDSEKLTQRLGITAPPVRIDSQAKYALVAGGQADIYLRIPTRAGYQEKIWDHAAGALVVTEAGGRVTDLDGKELDFSQGPTLASNRGVLVTNGAIHGELLEALRRT
jgi:3'(2'), 5'-bisphosphate nucleotidase